MTRCLLAVGSNLGDRETMLRDAASAIAQLPNSQLLAQSQWLKTSPVGGPEGQGAFLNGALLLETQLPPHDLCRALLGIESDLGRQRDVRWDARAIDIDLLLYGEQIISSPELTVPHPRMSFRQFVLVPATEIAGEMMHPILGANLAKLSAHLKAAPRYVAVTAAVTAIADWLATLLADELGCPRLEETLQKQDSPGARSTAGAIESMVQAGQLLSSSHWQSQPVLAARLPSGQDTQPSEKVPVVSGFWGVALAASAGIHAGHPDYLSAAGDVKPALVIAIEPTSSKDFSKKIFGESFKKKSVSVPLTDQEFTDFLDRSGQGPMARIQTDDPAEIIQEVKAALDSAWSD